jgi:hypothetical protein
MKWRPAFIALGLILVLTAYSFAQMPQMIAYQGGLTKASGASLDRTFAIFLQTVTINSQDQIKVFIQLKDDYKGKYVKASNSGSAVYEPPRRASRAILFYQVVSSRERYENLRLAKGEGSSPEEVNIVAAKQRVQKEQQKSNEPEARQNE